MPLQTLSQLPTACKTLAWPARGLPAEVCRFGACCSLCLCCLGRSSSSISSQSPSPFPQAAVKHSKTQRSELTATCLSSMKKHSPFLPCSKLLSPLLLCRSRQFETGIQRCHPVSWSSSLYEHSEFPFLFAPKGNCTRLCDNMCCHAVSHESYLLCQNSTVGDSHAQGWASFFTFQHLVLNIFLSSN